MDNSYRCQGELLVVDRAVSTGYNSIVLGEFLADFTHQGLNASLAQLVRALDF